MLGLLALLGLASAPLAAGCGASPAITVVHLGPGDSSQPVHGDPVKVKRGGQESYVGLHGGFYVVRSAEDWRNAWPGGAEPALPRTLDTSRSMLLLAVGEHKETVQLRIDSVVETGNMVHVTVRDTRAGDRCTPKLDRVPADAVVAPRIDKPVKFYVHGDVGEACGEPPAVTVSCRRNDQPAWRQQVAAQLGDRLDCEMKAESRGKFAVIDRSLSLGALPGGSAAKLQYAGGPTRGAFPIDVFGTYTVQGEATDEGGRKSVGVATVEALPPRSRDVLVQLAWTNFDVSDDPETFPRLRLRALEEGRDAKSTRECSLETPRPEVCEVIAHSAYTHMVLRASDKRLPLEVVYADERIAKGPRVCVQLYFDGARTAETCDGQQRSPAEAWRVGIVEMSTGTLDEPRAKEGADAGAEAGAGGAGGAEADAALSRR